MMLYNNNAKALRMRVTHFVNDRETTVLASVAKRKQLLYIDSTYVCVPTV